MGPAVCSRPPWGSPPQESVLSARQALSESLEDYLETIHHLVRKNRVARVKDIAARMEVHMSSVTGAVRALAAKKLVHYDPYSYVTLTERGEAIARDVARRHEVLAGFLTKVLGVGAAVAARSACHMEHAIEPEVLKRLIKFVEFMERCPRGGYDWINRFGESCDYGHGRDLQHCERCLLQCLGAVRAEMNKGARRRRSTARSPASKPGAKRTGE